jgi:NitT/TauT family transport system substrate-binding protein
MASGKRTGAKRWTAAWWALWAASLLGLVLLVFGVGCRGTSGGETTPDGKTKVRLQLNWVPEPEFGGFYAAEINGYFAEEGLAVEIVKGSAGVPAPQLTAAGKVEFGIVGGDQVVALRAQGAPLVALYASFQTFPRSIAVHAESPHTDLTALWRSDARLALEPGLPFARWLGLALGPRGGEVVPATGGLAGFIGDQTLGQAVFAFAEPVELEARGIQVRVFDVAATGYNPYTAVLATSDTYLAANPAVVEKFVRATRRGWAAYLANPGPTNAVMAPMNPAMSQTAMDRSAALARPYLLGETAAAAGTGALTAAQAAALGRMTAARWQTLTEQLTRMGVVEAGKAPEAAALYREFP